jgi:membrane protease YdiL (CAAX protease family)
MNTILFDEYGRLRSGWRFTLFVLMFFFAATLFSFVAGPSLQVFGITQKTHPLVTTVISAAVGLLAAALAGWACGRFLDRVPFRALGVSFTKGWAKDLALGVLMGAGAVVIAVLFAMAFGGLGFTLNTDPSAIARAALLSFIVFTVGAAFEEILVRGYIFQTFVRSNLAILAILLTSLIFASGHIGNPDSGYFSFVNTALAGIWLGAAYLKTRTLWLPIGLHFAWNFVLGAIFGIEVSGLKELASAPLLKELDKGPVWLTGGDYGLEGGLACTIALIVVTIAVWYAPFLKADEEMVKFSSPPALDSEE